MPRPCLTLDSPNVASGAGLLASGGEAGVALSLPSAGAEPSTARCPVKPFAGG